MKTFLEEKNWLSNGAKLFLTMVFLAGAQGYSQIESPVSSAAAQIESGSQATTPEGSSVDEAEHVDEIMQLEPFSVDGKKDPFKPLVEKPKIEPLKRLDPTPVNHTPLPTQAPQAAVVPPLKLSIQGIVGNESERLAMVNYENELKILHKDDEVKGTFKVVDILPDKMVVFSIREGLRRTFTVGGGKE